MDVNETALPGVGLRYDFLTRAGRQVGVVAHRGGRRDLLVYDREDPDTCREVVQLTEEEADTLADMLGAARIAGRLAELRQRIEGLAIDWLELRPGSPYAGRPLGDTQARSRTGTSIVAVLRGEQAIPAPSPDLALQAGDTAVVVGTPEGIAALGALLGG
ncbi:MAG TPA: cation:proton antiporter regulatory subunit [Actinomycetes bacterium]|nr:cation:proton antiporter regulatory subunit [Actinomycetes bacterium]